ncbi:hypothetical protein Tcan_18317 [Toxocara canis]|uniref:Uncharacterized protein n=1 Tax=Toxocara canis TaxID=6265 RepID=A0A0B2VML6_TOXCA|nr:hypothetical protein Tcan_18317 [Toxocara canis]
MPYTSTVKVIPDLSTTPPTSTAEVSPSLLTTPHTSTAEVSLGLSTTPHKGVVEITPNLYNESQKTVTVAIELNKTLPAIATTLSPITDSTFDRNSTILTSAPSFITWLSTRNFTSSEMSTNETTWTKNVDLVSGTTHSWKLDGANKSLPDSNVLEKDAAKTLRTPTDRSLTTSDEISGVELPSSSRQDVDHYEHPSLTLPPDIIVKTSDYRQVELTTSERPKREVKPIKAANLRPTTHSSGMGGLVGGVVGGVSFILIAVIVAVLLIFKMKKNRKKNVEDSSNADETRTIQDVPPKNQWAPDKIAASQFTFKGPLRIPFKQPLIAKHELENEGPPSHHDDVHVQFDDKLNEVYEIGSEVEIIVVDKSEADEIGGLAGGIRGWRLKMRKDESARTAG